MYYVYATLFLFILFEISFEFKLNYSTFVNLYRLI